MTKKGICLHLSKSCVNITMKFLGMHCQNNWPPLVLLFDGWLWISESSSVCTYFGPRKGYYIKEEIHLMKSLNRTLSLVLVLVMVLGLFGVASAAKLSDFTDKDRSPIPRRSII